MMSGSDDNTNTSPHQLILGLVLISKKMGGFRGFNVF